MKLMIDIDEDIYTRLYDNGAEDFDVTEEDLCEILRSVRKGVLFIIGIDADGTHVYKYIDGGEF